MEERMLKVSEVADRLQTTPPTVRKMLKTGILKGIALTPTTWRVPESVLDDFIEEQLYAAQKRGAKRDRTTIRA